jgi:hypothetical protein
MKRVKSVFTTFIGVVLIGFSLYFVYEGKTTLTEAAGFITIGVALIFSDDENFSRNFLPFLYKGKSPLTNENLTNNTNDDEPKNLGNV